MDKVDEKYSAREAKDRTEAALRAAFKTPHKSYEESKVGKRKRQKPKARKRQKAAIAS